MAQTSCERDGSRDANPKMAHFIRENKCAILEFTSRELSLSKPVWFILESTSYLGRPTDNPTLNFVLRMFQSFEITL